MHDYAIFNHNRASIGRWLGVIALMLSGAITQCLVYVYSLTQVEAIAHTTITIGAIYFGLHWIFNNVVWKKISQFGIPNLNGKWEVQGKTLNEDGTTKFDWDGIIGIEQTWEKIAIHQQTETSQSHSYTATIEKINGLGGWLLSYSYGNDPYLEQQHELQSHKGYCQIQFDKKLKTARANYFNRQGRQTYGTMQLDKKGRE